METKNFKLALNCAKKPNRGLAFESDLERYYNLIQQPWLAELVSDIRNGHDELKELLPLRCSHYYRFKNNHRSQEDMDPESFLFQTCVDIDDPEVVEQSIIRVKEINEAEGPWKGMLLHLEYSARKKLHIDIRMPIGMTIEETHKAYSEALGVEFDPNCITPERAVLITDAAQTLYTSEHWYEVLSDEELQLRRKAYQERGLTIDGRRPEGTKKKQQNVPIEQELFEEYNKVEADTNCLKAFELCMAEAGLTERAIQIEGVRHNSLVSIFSVGACRLMPKEQMIAVVAAKMPEYATEKDCQQLISDFYANYTEMNRPMTRRLREIHAEAFNEQQEDTEPQTAEESPEAPAPKYKLNVKKLPSGLREPVMLAPENAQMSTLCAIMPIAATYADQVRYIYADGSTHHLGIMTMVVAKQAGGKSSCKIGIETWMKPLQDESNEARAQEDIIKNKNKLRKANERATEMPKLPIRKVPITISCSTYLKRQKAVPEHTLYSFCEEADTMHKTNSAGSWSAKYDLYRYSFDRAQWGQDYNSDQAESGEVNVAYNWTIFGTYGAFDRCFCNENTENGLASRILMSPLPDNSFAQLPKIKQMTQEEKEAVWEAAAKLRSISGYVDVTKLTKAIEKWLEEKRIIAMKNMDTVMDDLRKRSGVIALRCAVIYFLLEETKTPTKGCIEFMLMMADYILENQMRLLSESLKRQEDKHLPLGKSISNQSTFDRLPEVFTIEDLRIIKGPQFQDSSYRSIACRWGKEGLVEVVPQEELGNDQRTHWRKKSA